MRITGHVAGGILAAGAVIAVVKPTPEMSDRLLLLGAVAGSLPDWDVAIHVVRTRSFEFDDDFRHHRYVTHTLPFYIVPALAVYLLAAMLGRMPLQWAALVFGLATTVHLLQDMVGTGDGIMLLYPFRRQMFGVDLTHTHGRQWLKDFRHTVGYKLELGFIALASLYLAGYLLFRVTNWQAFSLGVIRIVYLLFLAYLTLVLILFFVNVAHQSLSGTRSTATRRKWIYLQPASLFQTSIAFNGFLAFLSVLIPIVAVALAPITVRSKLIAVPIIISSVAFIWGTRQTGLGSIAGSPSTAVALIVLAALDSAIVWWEYAPLFFAINLVGHTSGWLGGFTAFGQIREASCFSYFTVELGDSGESFQALLDVAKSTISECYHSRWDQVRYVDLDKREFVIAEWGIGDHSLGSLLSVRNEMEWAHNIRPQMVAARWLREEPMVRRSYDQILDQVFNVWRNYTTRLIVCDAAITQRTGRVLELVVMTFWETSSMLWVDQEIVALASDLHHELCSQLEDEASGSWRLGDRDFFLLRGWNDRPKLEQYAKQTWAAQQSGLQALEKLRLEPDGQVPSRVVEEFRGSQTLFNRWRGKATSLVTFVITQVVLVVVIEFLLRYLE